MMKTNCKQIFLNKFFNYRRFGNRSFNSINLKHVRREALKSKCNDWIHLSHYSSESSNISDVSTKMSRSFEEVLFDMFKDENRVINVNNFLSELTKNGIKRSDPRFAQMFHKLKSITDEKLVSLESLRLEEDVFKSVIKENLELIRSALNNDFIIPYFDHFSKYIEEFYWKCKVNCDGKVANYIPQLAKYNADYWAVSVCTIHGQRYSIGDIDIPFTIQSTGKPISYGIALNELGTDLVHQYVGQEPSGRMFNELVLDYNHKPHNPMVNAGAIVICSLLLHLTHPEMRIAEKFDWISNFFKLMCGGEYLSFNNSTFLSERETADRNFAIAYYMKENKCFPQKTSVREVLDFYFQMCSLEVNCDTVGVMAATLANGGICPITGELVLSSQAVRDVLSLMHSCGMYDYSGQFAFKVGLPTKSGVSGSMMIVVPNVMGICCWSPPLDSYGNSVRGVQFCNELISTFNFHHYDNLLHSSHKKDPRKQKFNTRGNNIVNLLFSAAEGDLNSIKRFYLSKMDMELKDYDDRTALHLASAEGHLACVKFLLKNCNVQPDPKDRWGNSPLDDAIRFGHHEVCLFLQNWINQPPTLNSQQKYTKQDTDFV